jgi:hypothetical protein
VHAHGRLCCWRGGDEQRRGSGRGSGCAAACAVFACGVAWLAHAAPTGAAAAAVGVARQHSGRAVIAAGRRDAREHRSWRTRERASCQRIRTGGSWQQRGERAGSAGRA